jgi:hypothetical protein
MAANYYIDFTNGLDTNTGLKYDSYVVDSTADTTHFIDATLHGICTIGNYVWVNGRSGSLVSAFNDTTHEVTLATAIAGLTAADTFTIIVPWKTLSQYTSVTARTAGDVAYVRANLTETINNANVEFDESGTQAAIISIIGCDAVTNDPWHDASNTYPIRSFGDAAYQVNLDMSYWLIKRLIIQDSTKTGTGTVYVTATGNSFSYCNITDNSSATAYGLYVNIAGGIIFLDNCTFNDNKNRSLGLMSSVLVIITNCTFDGGGETTGYGIYASTGALGYVSDSAFGIGSAHDVQDIYANAATIYCRNVAYNKATLSANTLRDEIHSEDDDGTFGNQVSYYFTGTVTKSATAAPSGEPAIQMLPSTNCGAIFPLSISNLCPISPDFAIWNTSTSPLTVTVKIRSGSAWATPPTNTQLWLEASYLSNAASAARTIVKSTQTINADGTTWVDFTCGMTPARAGAIYLKVYLNLFVSTEGILVDPLWVVT